MPPADEPWRFTPLPDKSAVWWRHCLARRYYHGIGWRGVFWSGRHLHHGRGHDLFRFPRQFAHALRRISEIAACAAGWEAYKACLKNKNILLVSLVFMAGAAGRGQDINEVYIIPHFVRDFHLSHDLRRISLYLYSNGQLDRTVCLGLDFRSFQPQAGDPSLAVDVRALHALARLAKEYFRGIVLQSGDLRRGGNFAANLDPGAAQPILSARIFSMPRLVSTISSASSRFRFGR